MTKTSRFMKMLGDVGVHIGVCLGMLELPEEIQEKNVYRRKKDNKKTLKRRGYITTVEANMHREYVKTERETV